MTREHPHSMCLPWRSCLKTRKSQPARPQSPRSLHSSDSTKKEHKDEPKMSLWQGPPPPPTKLGRYRQLAPRAAIHVSPLALGGMSLGTKWANQGFGEMNKESSFKLLDAYFDAGGNFIDTASN